MNEIYLNFGGINDKIALHDYLKDVFKFPEYYGKNLDALYDCLTEISEPVYVSFAKGAEDWGYLDLVMSVFEEAAKHDENIMLTIS